VAAEATAEPTEGRAVFGRDGLFSRVCVTIFRRLAARRALRSPADAGLLGVEYRVAVTPSLSALFQGFPNFSKEIPRKFQGNSKLFQGFPNFFLGRFEGNQGVVGRSSRNPVFSNFCVVSAATGGPAIRRRTRSRFNIARSPIIGKKLSAAEIVGGNFPWGPRGERGVDCPNAKADRRDAGAVRLRRRAPSRGGAAPIEKVWRRLRVLR